VTPDDPKPSPLSGRVLFLDGLRGVAALCVAIFHFQHPWQARDIQPQLNATLPHWMRDGAHFLEYGVEVFFVLSGFVIAHSLWGQRITPRFAGNFALRRSIRLDPPYWVMIAFCIGWPYLVFPTMLDGFFARFDGWRGIVVNALYLPDIVWWRDALGWIADRSPDPAYWRNVLPVTWHERIVGVAWTLCLEVQFYLAYIALLAVAQQAIRRLGRAGPILAGTIFAALVTYSLARWFAHVNVERYDDFGSRWFMFFAGALLYATLAGRVSVGWLIGLLAAIVIGAAGWREPRAAAVALTTAAIWVAARTGGLQTWLNWRWLQRLGRLSYSFYLVHLPLGAASIVAVMKFSDGSNVAAYIAMAFAMVVSLIAADLLHRMVEAPAIRLSNRFKPAKGGRAEAAGDGSVTRPSESDRDDGEVAGARLCPS
jgi:peptidoglycan/LPS O-acetylase OafA/YrhL